MSSPGMYTIVDRTDDEYVSNRRRESTTRFQVPASMGTNTRSISSASPTLHFTDDSKTDLDYETSINREVILFVYLDLQSELTPTSIASLRAIHHDIVTYTDSSSCLDFLRSVHDRIFFISSSADRQLIEEFHEVKSVEAMFILNSDAQSDSRLAKLYGVYEHFEELLVALRDTLEWFEQTQMELFLFEGNRIFLWSLLWKEECIKLQKSRSSSTKDKLVHLGRNYYGENIKMHQAINEFDQCYVKTDALQWCFSSPFPSRFLRRAFCTHDPEHLQACQFLLIDASRLIQLASRKSSCELYKGMKVTNEFLEKLENQIGKLICPIGFLQCSQSRKTALANASSPEHRPDLLPVLFKVSYDTSVPLLEFLHKDSTSSMIFDLSTVFRVKYVSRGQVSTVKIELASEDGTKLARMYRSQHETENAQDLLAHILSPPKPPVRLPPLQRTSSPPPTSPDLSTNEIGLSVIAEDDEEAQAQELLQRGEIDQALSAYQDLKPESARIFNTIGSLYAEKKGDYESAIKYFRKALRMQEKTGEDVTGTLSLLGNVHQNLSNFELALSCHSRAFYKRKNMPHIDQTAVAGSLIGMANAYWGERNFAQALEYAQQALALNEAIERGNDLNVAGNLAILANIYHNSGDSHKALETATRALGLLERCVAPDSLSLATLINNVATIQVTEKLFTEARHSYNRALEICAKSLPKDHPRRRAIERNIQRITERDQMAEEEETHL